MMPSIPESEWQKKFNKTLSQDNSETWQNKFKKPAWQQDTRTWNEKFNHSTEYIYQPISKEYYIKQPAYLTVEGVGGNGGSYFFKGIIVLKEDGLLSVSAMGMTAASFFPQATIVWEMTAEIRVNGQTILKKAFKDTSKPSVWPKDMFTIIGTADFKLPFPKLYNKVELVLIGTYKYDTGTGFVQPHSIPTGFLTTSKKFSLDIIKKSISVENFNKVFDQLNPKKF